jgi:hypothetical protein
VAANEMSSATYKFRLLPTRAQTLARAIKSLAAIIKRVRPAPAILRIPGESVPTLETGGLSSADPVLSPGDAGWFLPGPPVHFLAPLGTIRAGILHCPGPFQAPLSGHLGRARSIQRCRRDGPTRRTAGAGP